MFINAKRIKIEINTTYTDRPNNTVKYLSRGPIKIRPLDHIIRAFLHSNEIKGTIHRICVDYIK